MSLFNFNLLLYLLFLDSRILMAKFSTLADTYQQLCDAVMKVEEAFGPPTLLLLVCIFEELVLAPFFCLINKEIFSTGTPVSINFIFLYGFLFIVVIIRLFLLLWPCSILEEEVAYPFIFLYLLNHQIHSLGVAAYVPLNMSVIKFLIYIYSKYNTI